MEGALIENRFEMSFRVRHPLLQGADQTHQGFASFSSGIGLRAEADFARNDGRAFPLGESLQNVAKAVVTEVKKKK